MPKVNKICTLFCILALSACSQAPKVFNDMVGSSSSLKSHEQRALIADLPIPSNTSILPAESLILGRDNEWTGRVTMSSSEKGEKVYLFYQQQMPAAGWTEVSSTQGRISTLVYNKLNRVAVIQVRPGTQILSTRIEVTVSPRNDVLSN